MDIEGHASHEGTKKYADRFNDRVHNQFFQESNRRLISSIGLGTYLGDPSEDDDKAYKKAVKKCVLNGVNLIDTAINYRFQRSERAIGDALDELITNGDFSRATKGGYVPFDSERPADLSAYIQSNFIEPGIARAEDFVGGSHCMAPGYLEHEIQESRKNLGLDTLDIYYVHNPETQFQQVDEDEFYERLSQAFEILELAVDDGHIESYGIATWNGLRIQPGKDEYIDLARVIEQAENVAGDGHHFEAIQLPYNLAMPEALTLQNQSLEHRSLSVLDYAGEHDLTVCSSASLLQGKLTEQMPEEILERMQELDSSAHCAIQFTRSAPGITSALVGMRSPEHIEQNLELSPIPPYDSDEYLERFFVEMDPGQG
ncbi:MAG: aldo/keto reductase [bacterium]